MKRWTNTWAAMLVTGFLAIPGTGFAQTPAAPAAPAAMTQDKAAPSGPQEHLKAADAALNSIAPTAVTGKAKSQVADLKKHIAALETIAGNTNDAKNAAKWSKEAAAADKILGELLVSDASMAGSSSASATTEPKPAGTSGMTTSKATASVALDDDTKAKLTTVRSSLTAFAAAMSGAAASPKTPSDAPAAAAAASPSAASSTMPSAPTSPAAPATSPAAPAPAAPTSPAEPTPATPAQPTSPAEPTPATPAQPAPAQPATPPAEPTPAAPTTQPPAQPAQPSEPTAQPTAATPAQPGTQAAAATPATMDADAAKVALTAARDSLSQMTQLPAAQQLQGDARTQVTQLIANFNELITTKTEWKASYAKVDANVAALIGADGAEASAAAAPAAPAGTSGTAGTAGAVGTSGSAPATIDAAVKAKLVEFRTHLKEFQKASGAADQK